MGNFSLGELPMSIVRSASVFFALAALADGTGLVLAGGTTGSGMGSAPPPPPPPPQITSFTCQRGVNNSWTFFGQVDNPTGVMNLTIEFDGIAAVNGQSVAVNPDGSFSLTIQVPRGQTGEVGATLIDDNGDEYGEEAVTFVT